eukprot:1148912-Pelagomonas_calceolata.AAC.2
MLVQTAVQLPMLPRMELPNHFLSGEASSRMGMKLQSKPGGCMSVKTKLFERLQSLGGVDDPSHTKQNEVAVLLLEGLQLILGPAGPAGVFTAGKKGKIYACRSAACTRKEPPNGSHRQRASLSPPGPQGFDPRTSCLLSPSSRLTRAP